MAHIRYIDEAKYAAKALDLLNRKKDYFIRAALSYLMKGASSNDARENLVDKVKSDMEDELFDYLKDSGAISKDVRYDYVYGYPRMKYVEPSPRDVPSRLLDITEIVPEFQQVIDSIMTEAGKQKTIADIEATAKAASEQDDK